MQPLKTRWSSQTAFIFASAAAAVGLGNIWRFPYLAGQHGGGAFVLVYLFFVVVLGIPLVTGEVLIGRIGRKNPVASMCDLAQKTGHSRQWQVVGGMGILTCFLIISYYFVITGWVFDYFLNSFGSSLKHITQSGARQNFEKLQNNPWRMLLTTSAVVVGNIFVISFGIKRGLERAVKFLFPALIVLLIVLVVYSAFSGGMKSALIFLFHTDFHAITPKVILIALGQAFFSLNVAMGITITFSAFLPREVSVVKCVVAVAIADTLIAIMAGLVIFPLVFAHHMTPTVGPSLIFQTLPIAFTSVPFGNIAEILFFLLLFFAAFTSTMSMLEVVVSWLKESRGYHQTTAAIIAGAAAWVLSLGTILSFSHASLISVYGKTFFDGLDYLTAGILLPVGGLLIAIFSGWLLPERLIGDKLNWNTDSRWFGYWRFIQRYIAPLAICLILLGSLGVF